MSFYLKIFLTFFLTNAVFLVHFISSYLELKYSKISIFQTCFFQLEQKILVDIEEVCGSSPPNPTIFILKAPWLIASEPFSCV